MASYFPARWITKPLHSSLLIALAFIFFSILYITYSSHLAGQVASDTKHLERLETAKGIVYVITAGVLIFVLTYGATRQIQSAFQEMERHHQIVFSSEKQALAGLFANSLARHTNSVITSAILKLDSLLLSPHLQDAEKEMAREAVAALAGLAESNARWSANNRLADLHQPVLSNLGLQLKSLINTIRTQEKWSRPQIAIEEGAELLVMTDPRLFQQAVINILDNAREAAESVGRQARVSIRLLRHGGQAIVEFHDNGPGIPGELRHNIFLPFFSTKRDHPGLGLLAVRGFVELAGGEVEAADSSLEGACLRLKLPLAKESGRGPASDPKA